MAASSMNIKVKSHVPYKNLTVILDWFATAFLA